MNTNNPRTAEEMISSIIINRFNLEHIAKHGTINGSLWTELKRVLHESNAQAVRLALEEAAEKAKIRSQGGTFITVEVDKNSILSLEQSILEKLK